MIQLEHLHIEEFRGIRSIDIPLACKSFVVHGPNGSGKSGVVDAIDFVLTGSVHRLTGDGTGGVSTAQHAPHVHARATPASALVRLTFRDLATGHVGDVTRTVGTANRFVLQPDTPELRAAFEQAQAHPEITLSRREIIKYVVSQPATRAQQVQDLLRLERVGTFRQRLNAAKAKLAAASREADSQRDAAEKSLREHLRIDPLTQEGLLRVVNENRTVLGVPSLVAIEDATDVLESVTATSGAVTINLATARADTTSLLQGMQNLEIVEQLRTDLAALFEELDGDPTLMSALKHRSLLQAGFGIIDSNICPLCGTEWNDIEALREHVQEQLARSEAAQQFRDKIQTAAGAFRTALSGLRETIDNVRPLATSYGTEQLPVLLSQWSSAIVQHATSLQSVDLTIANAGSFSVPAYEPPPQTESDVATLSETLDSMPDQTATVNARSHLDVSKERLARVLVSRAEAKISESALTLATTLCDSYNAVADAELENLYRSVESDFSRYYQAINSDDEGNFTARLTPTAGSLDLSVDFYSLGMFPPNAYHSEGHQDGMGVCLYLALMKHLLSSDFRLAVLDDVVMSVDVNHRRQFCELLKSEFPDVQFIITTHDEVWTRQMQSVGIGNGKQHARFYGWTVDDGPLYEQGDVWARIDEDLALGDVNGAAHKLRRRLEAAAADIAEAIGGRVVYKGTANYELSELLGAVNGRHQELLKIAADAANSWNDDDARAAVQTKKDARAAAVPTQQSESWAVNLLVHQNDWAQMTAPDLRPALDAAKAFLDLFQCDNPDCSGWIRVIGQPPATLKCDCGRYTLNLERKPSSG